MTEELGRYKFLETIGQGDFAIVYRAQDTELDRMVAVKELRPTLLTDTTWVKRFKHEARTIARLDHPRIVTIHDVMEFAGRLFIVMRLVDGPNLDQFIATHGALSWSQVIKIITAVAEGLDYTHAHNILHRDLKPANILLDPKKGPLLSDFGMAKLVTEASLGMTPGGDIVGTPHYIAPEVWESQRATPQTDIYALGCILYEMLTGEKLFKGETPAAVMMAHFQPLTLPDFWPEDVPSGLAEILETALARQSGARYATAGEMAAALALLTSDERTSILPSAPPTPSVTGPTVYLSLTFLGTFQVYLDDNPITQFESDKARALLAYLAVEADKPHRREQLAGLLWPDWPEANARANLRHALNNLRALLRDHAGDPPFFFTNRQTIQFNPASNYQLDVKIFLSAVTGASAQPAIAQLDEAAVIYQGPFLTGFSIPDSSAFEEWALLKRELFGRHASETLHRLAGYYEQQGAYQQALAHARRWLELEPWQEEAHQQVMRLLALSGRRNEALAHYESCRRLLAEELGVEPADETTGLYEQIRAGKLKGEAREQKGLSPFRHNLPLPLTPLIGRETELADLARLLADPDLRLVTVVGPGGTGKTRLALEAAAAQGQHFKDGVYLVSLAPLQSAETLVPAVAETLRFSFYENKPSEEQLLDYLRQKQMLLLMDNFEHLLTPPQSPPAGGIEGGKPRGVKFIIDLLKTAPSLKILTTSRTRLKIEGEQLYPLAGLAYPAEEAATGIAYSNNEWRHGAVALFEHSVRRLRPNFALTDDTLAKVVRICRLVEGMPLGLLLASTWIELLTPGEIAAEIERSFDFLQTDLQDIPTRQQSLRAVFDHSWTLLAEREQTIFQQLSIFRGSFSREAAQAVAGASLADLLALVNKFLLHRTPAGRYEVHELLRQFAAEKLAQSPAVAETARRRHSGFYAAFLDRREAGLKGARQRETLAEIEAEGENIRLAWQWAVEQQQLEPLDQAVNCLASFYEWRGRYQEGEAAYRAAAEMLKRIESGGGVRVLAKTLRWWGLFNRLLGQSEVAGQLARQSLSLLDSPALAGQDTRPEKAAVLLEIGQQTVKLAEARHWFEQALSLYRSLDDPWGTAQALALLGNKLEWVGTYDEGRQFLEESLQLRQTLGDQRGIAEVLESLGFWATRRGQFEPGEMLLRQGLAIRREMNDKAVIARGLSSLAVGLVSHGRFDEAVNLAEEKMRLSQDLGNRPMIAASYTLLCLANLHLGRYEQARSQGQMCLELGREIDDPLGISYALWLLGDVSLAEGMYTEAEKALQESAALHREIGAQSRLYDALASLGYAALGLGKLSQARQCLSDVTRMALEDRHLLTSLKAICLAALLSVEQGKPEQAVELYALASCYPRVPNSRWFEDVVGRRIAAVAAALPPEAVEAARARGKARDLAATVKELLEETA